MCAPIISQSSKTGTSKMEISLEDEDITQPTGSQHYMEFWKVNSWFSRANYHERLGDYEERELLKIRQEVARTRNAWPTCCGEPCELKVFYHEPGKHLEIVLGCNVRAKK